MRFAITGELGFIGTNLASAIAQSGNTFVSLLGSEIGLNCIDTGEPCVYNNTEKEWQRVVLSSGQEGWVNEAQIRVLSKTPLFK